MKKNVFLTAAACCALAVPAVEANAQDAVVVEEDVATVTEVPCKERYIVDSHSNWFIQFGAGVATPFVEGRGADGHREQHVTANYNFGFGKWFSPYLGWRIAFNGGALHWSDYSNMARSKYVSANLDFMWDMFNS
ncbi:MAG: OmpA family protein, partial [Muribaculaceae bacterium]|nr:OmpA family protein [Muribaculaceae bacterium]